jgi:hypothetical protein
VAHVFISYVREDGERVDRLETDLQVAGLDIWRDVEKLWPGDLWKRKLEKAVRTDAMAFVPCFSDASAERDQSVMFEELVWAVEEYQQRNPERPWIIPVLFDAVDPPDLDLGAGRSLSDLQWVRLDRDWDREIARLVQTLNELLPVRTRTIPSERQGTRQDENSFDGRTQPAAENEIWLPVTVNEKSQSMAEMIVHHPGQGTGPIRNLLVNLEREHDVLEGGAPKDTSVLGPGEVFKVVLHLGLSTPRQLEYKLTYMVAGDRDWRSQQGTIQV